MGSVWTPRWSASAPAGDRHGGDRPARFDDRDRRVSPRGGAVHADVRNIGWRGGPAPARIYIPELLDDVLSERINPGLVLDFETDLYGTPKAYAAMDDRTAIKSLIRVGSV